MVRATYNAANIVLVRKPMWRGVDSGTTADIWTRTPILGYWHGGIVPFGAAPGTGFAAVSAEI